MSSESWLLGSVAVPRLSIAKIAVMNEKRLMCVSSAGTAFCIRFIDGNKDRLAVVQSERGREGAREKLTEQSFYIITNVPGALPDQTGRCLDGDTERRTLW